ncbi:MAG: sugar transferase [Anaerolineaceae bacterium]|nr:sugar transferase [Anaerolineaceae bacterium]
MKKLLDDKPLLVMAVTAHINMLLFKGQIDYLQKAGFEVAVVCSPGWDNGEGAQYYPVAMEREIALWKDLKSLYSLIKLFRRIKPTIVNAGTPKAGLLVGLAAFITRVPVRVYTCHGLRLETLSGWKRIMLTVTEKITAYCAQQVVCVSPSLHHSYIALNLAPEQKVTVIGAGGCNGVDVMRFTKADQGLVEPVPPSIETYLSAEAMFIGFVGRLTKDKGVENLVEAFELLKVKFPNLYLLLLGEMEEGDPISSVIRRKILDDDRIIHLGFVPDPLPFYRLMKVLVLPTYREGLPTVLLEAGAMEIPVVASRATGCADVVTDGESGLLVPIGKSTALAAAIEVPLNDEALASAMGRKARQRVEQLYRQDVVWGNTVNFYRSLLSGRESQVPLKSAGYTMMKRLIDLAISGVLLVLSSPVWLAVAAVIKCQMGSPVFFEHRRPGLCGKPFNMYKFRTMTNETDAQGRLLPDEARLTKVGAVIRKLSLDELPQLINVLKGELSLVGPRPLLMKYLPLYTPQQARRHDVMPGITGWAQVNGRNAISWDEKFKLDLWYVENRSLWLDCKILLMTGLKVLNRDGISQEGYVNMSEFRGNMNAPKA